MKREDIIGKKYNKLTVTEYHHTEHKKYINTESYISVWKCICDCGNEILVRGPHLKNGNTKSCGCLLDHPEPSPYLDKYLKVHLTRGKFAIIDKEDWDKIKDFNWSFNHEHNSSSPDRGYALSTYPGTRHKRVKAFMSRIIMDAPEGMEVDHINHDGLDNRKENLRLCLHKDNGMNRSKPKNNTTGFKGVSRHKNGYMAQVSKERKVYYLGVYNTPEEASRVYFEKAQEIHKEFACAG